MGLTFEHPAWLWLLLLAVPSALLGLHSFASMSRPRRWTAVGLRVVLLALIAATLAGAASVRRTDRLAVIGVVDVSGSVRLFADSASGKPEEAIQAARAFLQRNTAAREPDDLAGLVVFGGNPVAVAAPSRADLSDRSLDVGVQDGSDIAAALRYAAALVPPGAAGRLVLISDGAQTVGDAAAAARELGSRGGPPIDVVPVMLRNAGEVLVEAVDAPPRAAAEAPVTVRVTLAASAEAKGKLTLLHNGEPLDINGDLTGNARAVGFGPGRHVELITVTLPQGRVHQFRAVFEPDSPNLDTRAENNSGEAFTYSPGKGSVLLVDGVEGGGSDALAGALRSQGIEVSVIPPDALPDNLLALQAYDLVILENVPAEAVPETTQKALDAHVRQMGAGLVMIGGPDSLGAGGWKGSILEPLLPVRLDLPERLVQPDAAIIFVMDNSGSMGRAVMGSLSTQQEIANQSAAQAVKTLAKSDLVGVIVFNTDTTVVVPLAPNTDPDKTAARIEAVSPGGGTRLGPALEAARAQLKDAKAAVKHVIVLSDGRSQDSANLPSLARAMHRDDGISISAISVGDQSDNDTMGAIASEGGGKFFAVNNATLLPRFFLKAVRMVRTPLIREGLFDPVLEPIPSPLTAGLSTPPPLKGLVLTQDRPEPTITYPMRAPTGEPLLAHWNVELGQVAVFTSDARPGGWADRWIDWPGYTQLWTQMARGMARATASDRLRLTMDASGGSLRLRLEALDERNKPLDLLSAPATIRTPGGEQLPVTLVQSGPGLYEAQVPANQSGGYVAIVTPRQGGVAMPPVIAGASMSSGIEFRDLRTNRLLLEQIAAASGGRALELGASTNLFDRTGVRPSVARTPLWRQLLLWTVLVLLLDIGTRRVAWDRFVSREFGVDLAKAARESVRERGREAAGAVSRLKATPKTRPAEPGIRLGEEDAASVAAAESQRRMNQRLAVLRELRESQERAPARDDAGDAAAHVVQANEEAHPGGADTPSAGPGDLLKAKRRARQRLEDQEGQAP